jgi:hypothetical protein
LETYLKAGQLTPCLFFLEKTMSLNDLLYGAPGTGTVALPTGGVATVVEMTGKEQRNFMNRGKVANGTAIQDLLGACVDTFKGEALPTDEKERSKFILDMLSGDRAALLFGIRRASFGDTFMFKTRCPFCEAEDEWEVDLSDAEAFKVTPYPLGTQKTVTYESEVRPGLNITVNLLDGHAEMKVLKNQVTADILSDLEARQPRAKDPDREQLVRIDVNRLSDKLITEMRRKLREFEGSIDTTVHATCKTCGKDVSFDLLQLQDFTIPSMTY